MTSELNLKGLVSRFVEYFNNSRDPSIQHLKMPLEKDLSIDISEDIWTEILDPLNFQLNRAQAPVVPGPSWNCSFFFFKLNHIFEGLNRL